MIRLLFALSLSVAIAIVLAHGISYLEGIPEPGSAVAVQSIAAGN